MAAALGLRDERAEDPITPCGEPDIAFIEISCIVGMDRHATEDMRRMLQELEGSAQARLTAIPVLLRTFPMPPARFAAPAHTITFANFPPLHCCLRLVSRWRAIEPGSARMPRENSPYRCALPPIAVAPHPHIGLPCWARDALMLGLLSMAAAEPSYTILRLFTRVRPPEQVFLHRFTGITTCPSAYLAITAW